jgi:transcriptional regulator with XRE-family HTH domain
VDGSELFRVVRRRSGLSQRRLSVASGVALSTVSAVESGKQSPTLAVLRAVLDVAGLELSVDVPPPALDAGQRRHLHHSLVRRLHLALGGDGRPYGVPRLARWLQLSALVRVGAVHLHGELAVRVWLPPAGPLDAAEVCAGPSPGARVPADTLAVVPACVRVESASVVIPLGAGQVLVEPPAELALDPSLAAHRAALRAVARELHDDAARDEAGRRARAHRDPDHDAEREHVFHTKRFGRRPMPDATDVRSWRLEDDAGLHAWLRRHGYPV